MPYTYQYITQFHCRTHPPPPTAVGILPEAPCSSWLELTCRSTLYVVLQYLIAGGRSSDWKREIIILIIMVEAPGVMSWSSSSQGYNRHHHHRLRHCINYHPCALDVYLMPRIECTTGEAGQVSGILHGGPLRHGVWAMRQDMYR
jgi:hypothetical protein